MQRHGKHSHLKFKRGRLYRESEMWVLSFKHVNVSCHLLVKLRTEYDFCTVSVCEMYVECAGSLS